MRISKQNLPAIAADFAGSGKMDRIYFCDDLPGFGIRFRQGSKRQSYVVQYERQGIQRRIVIGTTAVIDPDQARKKAKEHLAQVTLGGDPMGERARERAKAKLTFKTVAQRYLDLKQSELRPTSYADVKRYLFKSARQLHSWPIHRVEKRNIAVVLADVAKGGKVAASRARSTLSALFGWAIREGYIDSNPVTHTNDPDPRKRRDRVLTDAELVAVWHALKDDQYGRAIKLLIVTGQRRDEVGGVQWSELNRDKGVWTLPPERTKNGREHSLILPPLAWSIIGEPTNEQHLFGRRGYTNWAINKRLLDQRSGVTGWLVHDLRRTAATGMADLGIQPHIIEAVLNHVSGHKAGVAGIYNRSTYEREKRNALATWADHIASITSGEERKILEFPAETG